MKYIARNIFIILLLFSVSCIKIEQNKEKNEYKNWNIWLTITDSLSNIYNRVQIYNDKDSINFSKYTWETIDTTINSKSYYSPPERKYEKNINIFISKVDKETIFNQVMTIFKNFDFNIPKSKKTNRENFHLEFGLNDNYYRWVILDTERKKLPIELKKLINQLNKILINRAII
jgi:hypothetical protein